jgi:hypothetical protein
MLNLYKENSFINDNKKSLKIPVYKPHESPESAISFHYIMEIISNKTLRKIKYNRIM